MKIIIFILVITLLGCEKDYEKSITTEKKIQILIDEKRYDEAIYIIEEDQRQRASQKPNYTLLLASAYIGKSGFELKNFILSTVNLTSQIDKQQKIKNNSSKFIQTYSSLGEIKTYLGVIESFPSVDAANQIYLKYAITLLNAEESIPNSYRVLRALLNMILLKQAFFEIPEIQTNGRCDSLATSNTNPILKNPIQIPISENQLTEVQLHIDEILNILEAITTDLIHIQPSKKSNHLKSLNQLQEEKQDIQYSRDSLIIFIDVISKYFFAIDTIGDQCRK